MAKINQLAIQERASNCAKQHVNELRWVWAEWGELSEMSLSEGGKLRELRGGGLTEFELSKVTD